MDAQSLANSSLDEVATQVADKVVAALHQYKSSIPLADLGEGHVLVEPLRSASGKVVVLTQVPIERATNMTVMVVVKDEASLEQPCPEGHELDRYTVVMYADKIPGDLRTRTVFSFDPDEDDDVGLELRRQLSVLSLGKVAFFYMNIVQLPEGAPA